jgi:tRNA G18 (ribose-2'-O)-methylase SpoU
MTAYDGCLDHAQGQREEKDGADRARQPRLHFLLDGLQSPINIGKCSRTAEIFGIDLYVHDPRGLTKNPQSLQTISDFSCGAWERRTNHMVSDLHSFIKTYKNGRRVATCLQEDAVRLRDFQFADGDLIIFGNEYDGVDSEIIKSADAKVYIAMPELSLPKPHSNKPIDPSRSSDVNQNGIPNLNVAVAAGIVGYAYSCWREKNGYMPFDFMRP